MHVKILRGKLQQPSQEKTKPSKKIFHFAFVLVNHSSISLSDMHQKHPSFQSSSSLLAVAVAWSVCIVVLEYKTNNCFICDGNSHKIIILMLNQKNFKKTENMYENTIQAITTGHNWCTNYTCAKTCHTFTPTLHSEDLMQEQIRKQFSLAELKSTAIYNHAATLGLKKSCSMIEYYHTCHWFH